MKRRVAALALCLVAIGGALIGCSEESGNGGVPWPPPNSKALDRRVLALESGMSVERVRAELGEPLTENSVDAEYAVVENLMYGRWQLQFEDDSLMKRIKVLTNNPGLLLRVGRAGLDRKVRSLKLGMPMVAVRARLGRPEAYEIDRNAPKEEFLSYGAWELSFINGTLRHRQRW